MSMNLVQFQSKLSVSKIFQQFGIETSGTVIVDRALRVQSLSCSYYGDTASRLVFDVFQCSSCLIHNKKFRECSTFCGRHNYQLSNRCSALLEWSV